MLPVYFRPYSPRAVYVSFKNLTVTKEIGRLRIRKVTIICEYIRYNLKYSQIIVMFGPW